jgi:predicted nucleic acid-binding protein
MTDALADTSVFIARESDRPLRAEAMPAALGVSVITIGELRAGVLGARDLASRTRRLSTLTEALALRPLRVDDAVAEAWASLRLALRDVGRRMPINDSWIAATALSIGLPIVTQDDDYDGVPGLDVIHV